MARDELIQAQKHSTAYDLHALAMLCRRRFLRAADLLNLTGPTVERLRDFGFEPAVDLSPLAIAWRTLCARYLTDLYETQFNFFDQPNDPITDTKSQRG
jgi:hypothetical protein